MRLDARARQDVAILGSEFLKLDGKLFDHKVKYFSSCSDVTPLMLCICFHENL